MESSDKKDMPEKPEKKENTPDKEIIYKMLALEEKKIEIEKVRQENEKKELIISEKSSQDATELSKIDLTIQSDLIKKSFDFKNKIVLFSFIITFVIIIICASIIFYFGRTNSNVLDKFYVFVNNIIKFLSGAVIGYLLKSSKAKKDKTPE